MVSPGTVAAGDVLWVLWPIRPAPGWTGRRRVRRVEVIEVRPNGRVLARVDDAPAKFFAPSTVERWRRRPPE